ncbi:MAG: molybdopterin dinucleotide binding domain-containing protein [Bacillota bacterium]
MRAEYLLAVSRLHKAVAAACEHGLLGQDLFGYIVTTGRILYHFHTSSMSRRAKGLDAIAPEGFVQVHPATAVELGVEDGEFITSVSRRGRVSTRVMVTPGIGRRVVFMPFHFAESAANILTNPALDPVAKIPQLKVCAVWLEKTPTS